MLAFISELYPICRSVTGDGLRETLSRIENHIPLKVREVPTGTQVFDWTIPKEWNIRDAYVRNSRGDRVIDYKRINLHVVNYSVPVKKTVGPRRTEATPPFDTGAAGLGPLQDELLQGELGVLYCPQPAPQASGGPI
jgi:hypothetical protein